MLKALVKVERQTWLDTDMGSLKIHIYIYTKVFTIINVVLQQYSLPNIGVDLSIYFFYLFYLKCFLMQVSRSSLMACG